MPAKCPYAAAKEAEKRIKDALLVVDKDGARGVPSGARKIGQGLLVFRDPDMVAFTRIGYSRQVNVVPQVRDLDLSCRFHKKARGLLDKPTARPQRGFQPQKKATFP